MSRTGYKVGDTLTVLAPLSGMRFTYRITDVADTEARAVTDYTWPNGASPSPIRVKWTRNKGVFITGGVFRLVKGEAR